MTGGRPTSPAEKVLVCPQTDHASLPDADISFTPSSDEPPKPPREKFAKMIEGVAGLESDRGVWDLLVQGNDLNYDLPPPPISLNSQRRSV